MPYVSARQSRYLHAKKPGLAKKWDRKYGAPVKKKAKQRRSAKTATS